MAALRKRTDKRIEDVVSSLAQGILFGLGANTIASAFTHNLNFYGGNFCVTLQTFSHQQITVEEQVHASEFIGHIANWVKHEYMELKTNGTSTQHLKYALNQQLHQMHYELSLLRNVDSDELTLECFSILAAMSVLLRFEILLLQDGEAHLHVELSTEVTDIMEGFLNHINNIILKIGALRESYVTAISSFVMTSGLVTCNVARVKWRDRLTDVRYVKVSKSKIGKPWYRDTPEELSEKAVQDRERYINKTVARLPMKNVNKIYNLFWNVLVNQPTIFINNNDEEAFDELGID